MLPIIEAKKLGRELTDTQLIEFASAAADPASNDYQLSALLMAIRLNGMTPRETARLTMAMAYSGDCLKPDVGGVPVDKHSTGGVGDTTTLVLAPLVAACGGKVLKMSGRGLGHTGGTLDKLESIPGFRVEIPKEEFIDIVRRVGCAVVGQSAQLAPADKRLYALRDVTSTVDSLPLIVSSILSKKIASGAQAIVLDVKCGSGAIVKTFDESLALAKAMVEIGTLAGRGVTAVLTTMDEPLGSHVGNALEVKEAIDVLAGRVRGPLYDVAKFLGAHMLVASGVQKFVPLAEDAIERALASGAGLSKFAEMIAAQGGDARVCEDVSLLPQAPLVRALTASRDGYLAAENTQALGDAAQKMGAGRRQKTDRIDPAVGFVMKKRIGDSVREGEEIAVLHARNKETFDAARDSILSALTFSDAPVPPVKRVLGVVTKQKVDMF